MSVLQSVTRPIRVLHVDDDPAFSELAAEFLTRSTEGLDVVTANGAEQALDRLESATFECVVSDYDMPGPNGIEFLSTVRERCPDLPFILFTGKGSETIASEAISAGVTDYLQKGTGTDQYTVLANRIVNSVERYRAEADLELRTEQHQAVADLGRRALEHTGLEALYSEATRLAADRLDCSHAAIFERTDDTGELQLVAGFGWDERVDGTTIASARETQAGFTLFNSNPVVIEDLEQSSFDSEPLLADHDIRSGISVVVGTVGEPFGVLGVYTTQKRSFSDHDTTFVQNVANILGAAIERRRAEGRLRESEALFREIADLSPDGIFRAATDGSLQYLSPAAAEILSLDAEEDTGVLFHTFLTAESTETAVEAFSRVVAGEVVRSVELSLVDADGEPFEAAVSASPVYRDGEVALVQGFARDITERKERERALQRSRERYRTLVENFPDGGVFLFDEALRYTLAGGADLERVGLTRADFDGRQPSDIFPEEIATETEEYYRAALAGETNTFEQTYKGDTYRIRTVPVYGPDGDIEQGMAVSQRVGA